MSDALRQRILSELNELKLIDPHSHIVPQSAASTTLADILGYHYYTELCHSAGVSRETIEAAGMTPRDKVRVLAENIEPLRNTIQYSWFLELAQQLLDFPKDSDFDQDNWESLYDHAEEKMSQPDWEQQVIAKSNLEGVFLTNDFDDPLTGFDTSFYIPCLRTDDLVFHLRKPEVRERLAKATGIEVASADSLQQAIGNLFTHFVGRGARACAISLPPTFAPTRCTAKDVAGALDTLLTQGLAAPEDAVIQVSHYVFWTLAEFCDQHALPFDLMIGVNRAVYPGGVFQGQDLYDSRVSLIQYQQLFNAFPNVTFPVSVLASVTNQELVSYAWIFPNVVTNGHWWYSNTPTYIEHDASARLEAVPQNKQIGYYSDMYKLEFALPKFGMYKRILAKILAERWVVDRGWSEERAVTLGKRILRGNVESIFQIGNA